MYQLVVFVFFFFNDTATTEIYTLSLHDALPISRSGVMVIAAAARSHLPVLRSWPLLMPSNGVSTYFCLTPSSLATSAVRSTSKPTTSLPFWDSKGAYGRPVQIVSWFFLTRLTSCFLLAPPGSFLAQPVAIMTTLSASPMIANVRGCPVMARMFASACPLPRYRFKPFARSYDRAVTAP